jgi:hypothetical protein
MTSTIVELLAIGGHEDWTLWNHAILNGDQAHRNISTFYGWSGETSHGAMATIHAYKA